MSNNFDVNSYTIPELFGILQLSESASDKDIINASNQLINNLKNNEDDKSGTNDSAIIFLQQIQDELLRYIRTTSQALTDQTDNWINNEALKQSNPTQTDKITERKQKIDVYDNNHLPYDREQLGINNNYQVPVAQDVLNPNLKNVTQRTINLDSQFRQATGGVDSAATDYTLDLSDPLTDVVSIRLYSIQIPFTWYVINEQYRNTCFWIVIPNISDVDDSDIVSISFTPGNYTFASFVVEFNAALQAANILPPVAPYPAPIIINPNNAKVTIQLSGWIYTPPDAPAVTINGIIRGEDEFVYTRDPHFVFFDFTQKLTCNLQGVCSGQNAAFNSTLGWVMGFRLPLIPIYSDGGNTGSAVIDLYGPRYLVLVIDDYNQNHINNGLVTITDLSTKLDLPAYYTPTMPHICSYSNTILPSFLDPNVIGNLEGMDPGYAQALGIGKTSLGGQIKDKVTVGYGDAITVYPTAPRTLTQSQIYTINEISKNNDKNTSYRGKAPTMSDTFALIPIKHSGSTTGDLYVEFSGALQDNKRTYFGPVDISRMHVKLLDDRGFTLDLHGADWCVTLISENLYQY